VIGAIFAYFLQSRKIKSINQSTYSFASSSFCRIQNSNKPLLHHLLLDMVAGRPPPPAGPQHFSKGAPQSYAYRYSNCTERRKGLLIGINYFGQRGQLRGCINDVRNMAAYLFEHFG
jgi:hypothetical protein